VRKGRVTDTKPIPSVPLKPSPIRDQVLKLFEKYRGVVVGKKHTTSAAPDWIRRNFGSFKDAGVKLLFVEIKNKYQPLINDFLNGNLGNNEKSNEDAFRNKMQAIELSDKGVVNLIIEAKRLKDINVVAYDIETPNVFTKDGIIKDDKHRLEYANPAWRVAVNEQMVQQPSDVKFVMLVGDLHINKAHGKKDEGVNSLLDVPSIKIYDNSDAKNENESARIIGFGPKYMIPDSAISPNEEKLVPGLPDQSDYIGIVPDAPQKMPH
jgi:hypothetical protein